MKLKVIVFLTACLAAVPLHARVKSDVIIMKNGDKITCEVKSLSSNTLYISVDYILNTISVDWTKVDHIDSKQLFIVKTQAGTIYTGTLSTPETEAGRPLEIAVVEPPEKKTVLKREEVATVSETAATVRERLYGNLGTGFTYSKGNEQAQYNLNSALGYVDPRWSTDVTYNSNLTTSTGTTASTRNQIYFEAQRVMKKSNWYYTGFVGLLQSSVQGIRLQDSFGGAIGHNIVDTGSTFFSVYGGFSWQQIHYNQEIQPTPVQHVTAAIIGSKVSLFRFDRTNLTVTGNVLPALSDPGRVLINTNAAYYVKLWGKLNWNISFYGNWDNRPPPGFAGSDYGTSSGINISFGTP
jgi:Protein of unknown function, DUF481